MQPYTLRTDVFEGPLDLLLALIEKRKLLINDIALAEVADDYVRYLEQHQNFPIAETAQFVLVGSALLLIKSRSLLPSLSLSEDEQQTIEDLEYRLLLLEQYRSCAAVVSAQFGRTRLFTRRRVVRTIPAFSPLTDLTAPSMLAAMQSVLKQLPELKPKLVEATVQKVISLEEMIDKLTTRINASLSVSFRDFADVRNENKTNIIVSFLAMLELVRQGMVRVEQESHGSDIMMHTDQIGVPRYG